MRFWISFLCAALSLYAQPIKIASYNVENLFDAISVGTEYPSYHVQHGWTERMVDIKLNHTAEVICDLNADIIGLQEIENSSILKQLQETLARVGCPYRYRAITTKKESPIQVALLSRLPIAGKSELQVSMKPNVRNILEVKVYIGGYPLWIFVNHWKSKAYEGYESKRIAYAEILKKRLEKFPKNTPYLLMGDFNTDMEAYTYLEHKIDDTGGTTGLHHIIGTLDHGQTLSKEQMQYSPVEGHYMAWNELPWEQRWSTKFYQKRGTPDHFLLPRSLFDKLGIEYVDESFGVFKAPYLFKRNGAINRWQLKEGRHQGEGYSDHLPLYISLDTHPYQQKPVDRDFFKPAHRLQTIDQLYADKQSSPIALKGCVVIWKYHTDAIIKQSQKGRGLYLYKVAKGLEVGKRYDLLIGKVKAYKGLLEATQIDTVTPRGSDLLNGYWLQSSDWKRPIAYRQNEVIRGVVGVIKKHYFYAQGRKIPIHFKNRNGIPPDGTVLKIDYGVIGYYKRLQLVIYTKNDFTILEK